MAVGEVYKLTLNYRWNSQVDCSNVFFYKQLLGGTNVAENLSLAFGTSVIEAILNVAPTFCVFNLQQVVNVARPTDFIEGDYGGNAGDRTEDSDPMPSFLALQFKSTRAYPGTRSARKRFPFLFESDVDGNELTTAFHTSAVVTALAAALKETVSHGGSSFFPVVVAHPVVLGTAPVVRYDLSYSTFAAQKKVATQNTRKD